jgi:hypothetical protein
MAALPHNHQPSNHNQHHNLFNPSALERTRLPATPQLLLSNSNSSSRQDCSLFSPIPPVARIHSDRALSSTSRQAKDGTFPGSKAAWVVLNGLTPFLFSHDLG